MKKKYKDLIKDTGILVLGTFGSKVLSFLIVPLYTYVLTTSEFGTVDLFSTAVSLMVPFVTLQIQEALVRFAIGDKVNRKSLVTNCFLVFLIGCVFSFLFIPLYNEIFKGLGVLYYLDLVTLSFSSIFSQCLRVINKTYLYSINGIILTFTTVTLNVLFMVTFKFGIVGYLYSLIIAQFMSSLYVTVAGRLYTEINFKYINKALLKEMCLYSIPLIPNTLMWWIMNAGDKYIINYFIGIDANGIYALATKIPTILQNFYSIFIMAWQVSAIKESNDGAFYMKVFSVVECFLTMITLVLIIVIKPLFMFVLNDSYIIAWKYVPYLCIAMIISCYASYFGVFYNVYKKNNKVFFNTALGAVLNIVFNLFFVNIMGLYGIACGTILGYFVLWLIRVKDTNALAQVHFPIKRSCCMLALLMLMSTLLIINDNVFSYMIVSVFLLICVGVYKDDLYKILLLCKKFLKKRD